MHSNPKKVPRCHIPWQQMVVDATGAVSPCSFWSGFGNDNGLMGDSNSQSILEIWNSPKYQLLRKHMAEGDLEAAGCSKCFALKNELPMSLDYDPRCEEDGPSPYKANIETLKQEIDTGATCLKSKPTVVSFTPTHACNFRCTHCYQQDTRSTKVTREQVFQEVRELFPTMVQVIAGGGEPFIQPFWKDFIESYKVEDNRYLKFGTATNASMMSEKIFQGLSHFSRLNINISFDGGSKEVFEKVRVHGNYEKVIGNIHEIKKLVSTKPESQAGLCMSVMKSNILDLPNFIKLSAGLDLPFSFSPVTVMPPDESLCCFNNIQEETKGWREALASARAEIGRSFKEIYLHGDLSAVSTWQHYINVLEQEIPWHFLDEKHHEWELEFKPGFLNSFQPYFQKYDPLVYIYKTGPSWRGSNQYYAKVAQNKFKVYLPDGKYFFSVSSKWKNVELKNDLYFNIHKLPFFNIYFVFSHPEIRAKSLRSSYKTFSLTSPAYLLWRYTKPMAKAVLGGFYQPVAILYRKLRSSQ